MDLLSTSSASRTFRGMACTLQAAFFKSMYYTKGMFIASCARHPGVVFSYCYLVSLHSH